METLIATLLDKGADIEHLTAQHLTPLYCAALAGMLVAWISPVPPVGECAGVRITTDLLLCCVACSLGSVHAASVLLQRGADPRVADLTGSTPLHVAELPSMTRVCLPLLPAHY